MGKNRRKPENIRPITLLFHVTKTFERALLTKRRLFLTPRQEQYGFCHDIPMPRGYLEDLEDNVMLALYADDSAYFTSSRRADLAAKRIQRAFDLLSYSLYS
ncbi:hypothetical protein EVAR_83130_1 [Eumeta japonica]|uniref:Reverse transcriptase domain-containing protein n=1 Tax=Eumeta variegata TaxID=151549 RepID=A0A4C1YC42_EUMVA|nr:hypothetical protein EVAR_83130_1 [Eumeta japonica]